MQIIPEKLSSYETVLFREVLQLMIISNTTNGEKGHKEFDNFLEDYGEEYQKNMTDIHFELVENIILLEEISADPKLIVKLGKLELMMAKFALLELIPKSRFPDQRKTLLQKLDNLLILKSATDYEN